MIAGLEIKGLKDRIPWQRDVMIEQDLIISRALIDLYSNDKIRDNLIFRGGTALNKLYLKPPARYSEDLDFVLRKDTRIGFLIDAIREALSWLGTPKTSRDNRGFKMHYPFNNIDGGRSKLKIEINGNEIFKVDELRKIDYELNTDWYSGGSTIITYSLNELIGTKLRALYQRRKGRDLFDIWFIFSNGLADLKKSIFIFHEYNKYNRIKISKKMFFQSMEKKKESMDFRKDMKFMLPINFNWNFDVAYDYVIDNVLPLI